MNRATAARRLRTLVAADSAPCLDAAELDELVDYAASPARDGALPTNDGITATRATLTFYAAGATIRSAVTGGGYRYWRARKGGYTGPGTLGFPELLGHPRTGTQVYDQGVVWEDVGGEWEPTWNLNRAAARGWEIKAGKCAGAYDVTVDGQNMRRSTSAAACREQAALYRRRAAATLETADC